MVILGQTSIKNTLLIELFCSGLARRVQVGPLRQAGHAQGEQEEGEGKAPTLRQGKFFSLVFKVLMITSL